MKFEPGAKLGPYQILGELGRGGMATVYRAYQPNLEREVAIKVLPEFLVEQPGFKARFHREAVAVARLQHPNILSVFDHGEQDGVTFIVSEYVEGGTLASRMGAPIQLDYCVRILRPVADALDYAHSEGVIHRDVKPSNILLDRRGVPILSDFGLARVQEEGERLTQTGAMVGTPTYMAPEQCSGGEVGPPADIYALAVIAYEMVTGRVPFSGTNPLSIIAAHQMTPPPAPRKFNPSLPASIEQPLLAGLAKDPARRPETASDFVEALAAAIPGSASQYPVTPAPLSPLPPTPTAIEPPPSASYPAAAIPSAVAPPTSNPPSAYSAPPTPAPSAPEYTPVPPAPPQYTPVPPAAPQYTPPPPAAPQYASAPAPPAQYSPPPYAPAAPASYPYATAQATPPPSYPAIAPQPSYPPNPAYASAPQWTAPAAAGGGAGRGIVIALWAAVGVAATVALAAIVAGFNTSMDGNTRWLWIIFGVAGALAAGAALAGVLTVGMRDAAGRAPGATKRFGSAGALGLVLLLLLGGANAYGFSQQTSGTPTAQVTPTPTACGILKAGTPMAKGAVGLDCGFTVASVQAQLDCRSVTALPGPLQSMSYDDTTSQPGGDATFAMDSAGCHMDSATKSIESDIVSRTALAAGPTLMVADFLVPQTAALVGFAFGCDSADQLSKCIVVDLDTTTTSVYVWDDDNRLIGQAVSPVVGPNRLMAVFQGQQVRVWFNGQLIATETTKRLHGAGRYLLWAENVDDKNPLQAIVHQFAVYSLTK